ncbi:hypothetical protein GCM10008023_21030 [Sphingomonas glacialis]|uniref:Uncharacterized protein n=1 Tax=Sphingomonas glacialis TaxID=658225 RepID=A0ABQ3LI38_9SPHN|nr:hypothetical protein [Sphingomonas glacialis]GHH16716.1 hypothetical protein GCM10008023_21030 [Sphingomonas glacialis]
MPHYIPYAPASHGSDADRAGDTLFERMRRGTQMPTHNEVKPADGGAGLNASEGPLVAIDLTTSEGSAVRFARADFDGKPGVVMQEQDGEGAWRDVWSLPTQSIDAMEGMIGWLNTQGHRWDRFARMLHRQGADELTAWIFELMVVPSTAHATAPRFDPRQGWATIDQYGRVVRDDCACRARSIQHSRHF